MYTKRRTFSFLAMGSMKREGKNGKRKENQTTSSGLKENQTGTAKIVRVKSITNNFFILKIPFFMFIYFTPLQAKKYYSVTVTVTGISVLTIAFSPLVRS